MISVIIPVYNQADKIGNTLDSILAQTYQDIEIIAVNDGSSDNLENVIRPYQSRFVSQNIAFKYLSQQRTGAPGARNLGWRDSKGEYLFFCDADSSISPEAFSIMVGTLESDPKCSYAYSSFYWGKKFFKVGEFSPEKLRSGPCIHTMSMIRREHFPAGGWDESIKKLQDWDLWLTMLEQGRTGRWIDQALFTITPGGVYSNWLPSIAYKLLPWLPNVKKYNQALKIMKIKHKLP